MQQTSTVSDSRPVAATTPAGQETGQPFHADSGFIRHPDDYPLAVQVFTHWQQWRSRQQSAQGLGLVFQHSRSLRAGSWLELCIPMRDSCERFHGRVVMVRETLKAFEIGLRVLDQEQTARLRIVEQFCHMACYCHDIDSVSEKPGYAEAGQSNNHEQQARNWVRKFAAAFPAP